jgi:hypothetical protein
MGTSARGWVAFLDVKMAREKGGSEPRRPSVFTSKYRLDGWLVVYLPL